MKTYPPKYEIGQEVFSVRVPHQGRESDIVKGKIKKIILFEKEIFYYLESIGEINEKLLVLTVEEAAEAEKQRLLNKWELSNNQPKR